MAINNEVLNDVLMDTNAVSTSEADFRKGLEDTIRQVDTTQKHMMADRNISITGTVSAPVITYQLNDSGDYTTVLNTTVGNSSINTNALVDSSVTTAKINNLNVTNDKIANNTITTSKISTTKPLRILDVGGAELFNSLVLIP